MRTVTATGGLLSRGLILASLCGGASSALAVVGVPAGNNLDLDSITYNQLGPWRPVLVAPKPSELPGPFVCTDDVVNGEQLSAALVPPASIISACFDAANPPSQEVMDRLEEAMRTAIDESGLKYQVGSRWSGSWTGPSGTASYGALGDPITISWSFVPDGLSIPSGVGEPVANSVLFANLDAAYAAQGGRATWVNRFTQTFARWSQLSGLSYIRISGNVGNADADDGASWGSSGSATRGQVRIAAKPIDGGSGILAYNSFPGAGSGGNMVLDSNDSASWGSSSNSNRFIRNTISHEHGHGIGLNHVCPAIGTKLMEPFLNTGFDGPRQDDIRAGQRNYGDPSEPDNTVAAAKDRGALARSSVITLGSQPAPISGSSDANGSILSIDGNAEQDYHKFTPTQSTLCNFIVTPKGSNYANYAQDSACNNNTLNNNTLQQAQLVIDVRDGSNNLIATATAVLGSAVTLSNVFLAPGIAYYARVSEGNTPTQTQLYFLQLQGLSNNYVVGATDGVAGGVNVTWTAVTDAANYEVHRNTVNSEAGATLVTTVGAVTSFLDTSAPQGQLLYYFVKVKQTSDAAPVAFRSLGASDSGWTPCPADVADSNQDCNPDMSVDLNDYFKFLSAFDVSDACADIDGNPGVDLNDFFFFLNQFDAGC